MIKKGVAKILKNSFILLCLFNTYYRLKNKTAFWREVEKRKNLSIFDYKKLVMSIPFYPIERLKDSNFYGQAYTIKQYAGVNRFNWSIEHGLYYDTYIPYSTYCRTTRRVMTFSEIRASTILPVKPSVAIGPYIHYATSLLSDKDIFNLKKKLGKTLLFFPTHTCREGGLEYDIFQTIDVLKEFKNNNHFDTVIVNMYYLDEQKKQYGKVYENAGFKVVSAGHQLDLNFLNRLKTIILLADYTCSNSVGTHCGYCTYLNKPHLIINPACSIDDVQPLWKPIWKAYMDDSEGGEQQQQIIASYYWGFNNIKTVDEMRHLLECDDIL